MESFAPKYYKKFRCIAEKCRHTCCAGWEIDIDPETYEFYKTLMERTDIKGNIGKRLSDNINFDKETSQASFRLSENEKCPFLNQNNLCDIILCLSEDALCQTCSDHPRFRNYFENHIEMGLGMTCEEAARIILTSSVEDSLTLISLDNTTPELHLNSFSADIYSRRNKIFAILSDRSTDFLCKISYLLSMIYDSSKENTNSTADPIDMTIYKWASIYCKVDILDTLWKQKLENLKTETENSSESLLKYASDFIRSHNSLLPDSISLDSIFTKLMIYFIYRHYTAGIDPELPEHYYKSQIFFAIISTLMIAALCCDTYNRNKEISLDDITDISRMYSSEIEYSDENKYLIMDLFDEQRNDE